MKNPSKISNTPDSLAENVHRHSNWLEKLRQRAKRELTPKMFEMFTKYDENLVFILLHLKNTIMRMGDFNRTSNIR